MRIGDILEEKGGKVFTLSEAAKVVDAVSMLGENNIGVVVITGAGDRVIGLVSIGDIVKRKIEQAEREAAALRDYIAS